VRIIVRPHRNLLRVRAAIAALSLLAGCGRGGDSATGEPVAGRPLPCALAGATAFKPVCTVERTETAAGTTLILHHPDGGFRRLLVAGDGSGVVAADGADAALVTTVDPTTIEVALAGDRYRLPTAVKDQPLPER
jgi:hypothetical protein